MFRGLAPEVLLQQVRNTAAWALDEPTDARERTWRDALLHAPETPYGYDDTGAYFALLLAAHFVTVATFVPTDVDSHIRHHAWARCTDHEALRRLVDRVDATDDWDAHEVSARVADVRGLGSFSGHDGEWLSVRAGALGRALALDDTETVERISARIDRELDREHKAFETLRDVRGRELDALRVVTAVAHNLGDLSRIVVEWPAKSPAAQSLQKRYARLGHDAGGDPRFALAGRVNKAVTAADNHRFLSLRAARALRTSRDLLLPLGPFFDAWGAAVATSPAMGPRGSSEALANRGAAVAALLEAHLLDPSQQGVLRALAGFHQAHPGGVDAVEPELPARLRKVLRAGAAREHLGVPVERFEARMVNRYRAALAG